MADIYVDPSAGSNGSGTINSPRNIWPTSITTGDRIFLKRGTRLTVASQITLGAGSGNTIDAYGDPQAPKPIITLATSNFGALSIDRPGVHTIQNIRFADCTTTSNGGVINLAQVSGGAAAQAIIQDCEFYNINFNAIRLSGTGANSAATFKCLRNTFDRIGEDCIYGGALDYEVGYCTMTNLSNNTTLGDGVGFIDTDPTTVWIHHNYIDHSNVDSKQCIIIDTVANTGSGVIIEDNELIGFGDESTTPTVHTVVICQAQVIFRRNKVVSAGAAMGLDVNGGSAYGNIFIIRNAIASAPVFALTSSNSTVHNNTFIGHSGLNTSRRCVVQGVSQSGNTIYNNIFHNVPIAIQSDTVGNNPTATNNCFSNVISRRLNSSSVAFSGGNDIDADPLLDPRYKPTNLALAKAGTSVSGTYYDGTTLPSNPDIGAVYMGYNGFNAIQRTTTTVGNAESYMGGERRKKKRKSP